MAYGASTTNEGADLGGITSWIRGHKWIVIVIVAIIAFVYLKRR